MNCPDCKSEIGNSSYCGCGWKRQAKSAEPRPFIPCAHMACGENALTYVMTKTGWANLCRYHYTQKALDEAEKRCYDLGLDTVQQKREWVKSNVKTMLANLRPDYGADFTS